MGGEERIMVLWICAMVVSSMLMEDVANVQLVIRYPTVGRNSQMPCEQNGDKCVGKPVNHYVRECERLDICRGGTCRKLMPIFDFNLIIK
ncbi:hypothetical protein GQ457_06G018110 [Hibiscus cannabinus]